LGGCRERVKIGSGDDAGAIPVSLAQSGRDGPLVAAALCGEHAEADLVLYPLGERPQQPRCGCVLVACGDTCEAGEAVRAMPHVSFFDAERERLAVVAGSLGQVALVE